MRILLSSKDRWRFYGSLLDPDMNGCLISIFAWDLFGKMERRKEDLCGQILDEFQVSFLNRLILFNAWWWSFTVLFLAFNGVHRNFSFF